ncbi:unnamed protein product, partial [marine sediment metagenome]
SGEVKLKLYKGNCTVVGRKSPYSLYEKKLATYSEESPLLAPHKSPLTLYQ